LNLTIKFSDIKLKKTESPKVIRITLYIQSAFGPPLFFLPLFCLLLFLFKKIHLERGETGGSELSKFCGLGPAGFPRGAPSVAGKGGSPLSPSLPCRHKQGWIAT